MPIYQLTVYEAEQMISKQLKIDYYNAITDLKTQLDCLSFTSDLTHINPTLALSQSDIQ